MFYELLRVDNEVICHITYIEVKYNLYTICKSKTLFLCIIFLHYLSSMSTGYWYWQLYMCIFGRDYGIMCDSWKTSSLYIFAAQKHFNNCLISSI